MPPKKKAAARKPAPKKTPAAKVPKQEPLDKRYRRNTSGLQPSTSVTYSGFNRSRRPFDYILSQLSARPDLHPLRSQAPMGPPTWAMQGVYDPFDPLAGVRVLSLDDRRALNKDADMQQADAYVPPEDAEMDPVPGARTQFGPMKEPTLEQVLARQPGPDPVPESMAEEPAPEEQALRENVQAMADSYAQADDPQYSMSDRMAFLEDQLAQQLQQQVTMQQMFEQQQRNNQLRQQEFMAAMYPDGRNVSSIGTDPVEPEAPAAADVPDVLGAALETVGGPGRVPQVPQEVPRVPRRPMTIAPERVNIRLVADTPWMQAEGPGAGAGPSGAGAGSDGEDAEGAPYAGRRTRKSARVRKGAAQAGDGKKHQIYRPERLGHRKKKVIEDEDEES